MRLVLTRAMQARHARVQPQQARRRCWATASAKKDRADKIRLRKQEGKRTDHLARAIREEERSAIETWSEDVVDQDEKLYVEHEKKKNADKLEQHEKNLKDKALFSEFKDPKYNWCQEILKK